MDEEAIKQMNESNSLMPMVYVFLEGLRAAEILDREDIVLRSMGYQISWTKIKEVKNN